jgi:hypothetical protein
VSERLAHVLEVVDGPDQLFLLIHILIGFITQLPFKLQNLFDLRADAAMEYLVIGRLEAMQVLGIFTDRGLQGKIKKLGVSSKEARALLVAAAKPQTPLLLDLVEPVSKVINFPNLLDLLQRDILRRAWH